MRKLKVSFLSATFLTIAFGACNDQTEAIPSEPRFVEVTIPDAYRSTASGKIPSEEVDDVILDVQITTNDGREIVGKVHLIMPDDGTLSYFAMTENLLSETGLSVDYWVDALSADLTSRLAKTDGCFANCKGMSGSDKRTCKAVCWLEIVSTVVSIISGIVVLL